MNREVVIIREVWLVLGQVDAEKTSYWGFRLSYVNPEAIDHWAVKKVAREVVSHQLVSKQ